MKKLCYVCSKRAPSVDFGGVFCSRKCAAEYGVGVALNSHENDVNWCDQHGWFVGYLTYDGCPECLNTPSAS